jgi:hypothetical protein
MTEVTEDIFGLKEANLDVERIARHLGETGLDKVSSILSEGFCPSCCRRGSANAPFEMEDDEKKRKPSATVNCASCDLIWRAGPNPESEHDWIEFTRLVKPSGMILTITYNPPPEPIEDDWDVWDED